MLIAKLKLCYVSDWGTKASYFSMALYGFYFKSHVDESKQFVCHSHSLRVGESMVLEVKGSTPTEATQRTNAFPVLQCVLKSSLHLE